MASYAGMPERYRLAYTIMGEAGNQSRTGQDAVAHNIMNRAYGYNGAFGKGVEGVIMKDGAYSMWNDTTGYAGGAQGTSKRLIASTGGTPPQRYLDVADDALSGRSSDPTGGSTHYFAGPAPRWFGGDSWTDTGKIGAHTFGVADGRAPYDGSNPDDPRSFKNSSLYGLPYDNFSKSDVSEGMNEKGPYDFSKSKGSFGDLPADSMTDDKSITDQKEKMQTETVQGEGDSGLSGNKVSTPKAGNQGQAGSVPQAIVSAADQEAKANVSAAKTTAESTLKAAETTAKSAEKLQSDQQTWLGKWGLRIFMFIIAAIFIAGALALFANKSVDLADLPLPAPAKVPKFK